MTYWNRLGLSPSLFVSSSHYFWQAADIYDGGDPHCGQHHCRYQDQAAAGSAVARIQLQKQVRRWLASRDLVELMHDCVSGLTLSVMFVMYSLKNILSVVPRARGPAQLHRAAAAGGQGRRQRRQRGRGAGVGGIDGQRPPPWWLLPLHLAWLYCAAYWNHRYVEFSAILAKKCLSQ
jgi:hypothetical protein